MTRNRPRQPDDVLPVVDDCADRLFRAGWSCGDAATAGSWLVTGTNGENAILAEAPVQARAWRRAGQAACAVGMLRRGPEAP
jgi:hypothetical protein